MKKIILEWLKGKANYCYYNINDKLDNSAEQFGQLYFSSRVDTNSLEASKCYLIKDHDDSINDKLYIPNHYKYKFSNFNIIINNYVNEIIQIIEYFKNFTDDDNIQNRMIIIDLINKLIISGKQLDNFFSKDNQSQFQNIFYDINKNNYSSLLEDIKESLLSDTFNFKEFDEDYIKRIDREIINLNEIAVFFPFKFDQDILSNKYYLCEINTLKFSINNPSFDKIVDKFYTEYGVNSDYLKELFTLDNYFEGMLPYNPKEFAFFDPFYHCEKYNEEFKILKINLNKKFDFKEFTLKLFDFFNSTIPSIVKFQQENLINELENSKGNGRLHSIVEVANKQLIKFEKDFQYNSRIKQEKQVYVNILSSFIRQPNNKSITKNTTIDELGYKGYPNDIKSYANLILNDMKQVLNKQDSSKLSYIINQFNNIANNKFKNYKLNKESKIIIKDILIDIAFFYDKEDNKLSRPYNKRMKEIYNLHSRKDISKIINFNFSKDFINKNREKYDKYRPFKLEGENKFIMTYT